MTNELPMPTRGPVYADDADGPQRPYILAVTASDTHPRPQYAVVFGDPTGGGAYWPALGVGGMDPKEAQANRDLIVAAFIVSEEARKMGYDPIAAVQALPDSLRACKQVIHARGVDFNETGKTNPKKIALSMLRAALAAARTREVTP